MRRFRKFCGWGMLRGIDSGEACAVMGVLLPLLFAAATPCPSGERVMTWQGMTVRRREEASGWRETALAFCRGNRLVRKFVGPEAQRWEGFKAVDLTGDGVPELTSTYWTGGAHCCSTQMVFHIDRRHRLVATQLAQGDSETGSWRTLPGYPRPVMLLYDFSSAYMVTAFSATIDMPYVVEIGPRGFRIAEPLMRAREPGWGPAALRHGPAAWANFLSRDTGYDNRLAQVVAPGKRLAAARKLADTEPESPDLLLAAEEHIKLYCYYDARCDVPGLLRAIEGPHRGLLGGFPELVRTMRQSNIARLRRAPAGWR
jgi:hypothetical protein